MPIPQDARKKPLSIKVHVSTGEGVEITWSDMHTSRYAFPYLRDHCPCALCNDEREKKANRRSQQFAVASHVQAARHGEERQRRRELRDTDPILR